MADYWGFEEADELWPDCDPTRISKTTAMKKFHLKEADLRELKDVTTRPNPYRMAGGTVRLYLIEEVEELAARKEEERAALEKYKRDHAEEIAEEKARKAREAKEAAADAAAQQLESWQAVGGAVDADAPGNIRLPSEVLGLVLEKLLSDNAGKPTDIYDIPACAQQLTVLSQVCVDFYHAVHSQALPRLTETAAALQRKQMLPAVPAVRTRSHPWQRRQAQLRQQLQQLRGLTKGMPWRTWDGLVSDPQAFVASKTQAEIKRVAKVVGAKVTGTKAELVVRLVQLLGLKGPAAAPAQLLAVLQEQRLRSRVFG